MEQKNLFGMRECQNFFNLDSRHVYSPTTARAKRLCVFLAMEKPFGFSPMDKERLDFLAKSVLEMSMRSDDDSFQNLLRMDRAISRISALEGELSSLAKELAQTKELLALADAAAREQLPSKTGRL